MTYRGAVVDLDGTVYRDEEPIPGAADGIRALREAGLSVLFVTNNPTLPPERIAARLREQGIDADAGDVLTAAGATRAYLRREHPDELAFVLGEAGFREQLADVPFTDDPEAAAVFVASIDRTFDYDDLDAALVALSDGTTAFVGSDPDRTIPGVDRPYPGSGAIIGAVSAVSGRDPDAVLGKPSQLTLDVATDRLDCDPGECLLVGDRLDTDIAMGERAGMTTALVLTGVTAREEVPKARSATGNGADSIVPDHVLDSLAVVASVLDRE